ncbi:unnamed protein product [Eruca vesicaria subsp. sativa]|uniref:Replication factor A C-terminal domain-containing protein n=1 Tax=Eruca vesicaria subsp. sativa TaxID=29727 RepID=A0ABC8LVF4_ERUVS|nr:unnamed protein product [Eruca vesicaria subsp. sativa]
MANSYTLLDDLKAGRCSKKAEVTLLWFWEARNTSRNSSRSGELMSLNMLLIDENATLMQASIAAVRQLRFRQSLTEGSVYRLTGFDVTRRNPKYRLSDATLSIRFTDGTSFEKLNTTVGTIPTKLLMITLRLDRDVNVCVSMFDSQALGFHSRLDRLSGGVTNQIGSSSKVVHSQKIEPLTVAEFNQFVITADPQIIEFLCTAKVTKIQKDEGWCYIGCSKRSKKLIREENSFTCVHCNESNAVAELRYQVILSVSDASDTASLLGFDTEIAKLMLIQASEAAQVVGIGVNTQVDTELPGSLAVVEGLQVPQSSLPGALEPGTFDTSTNPSKVAKESSTSEGVATDGLPAPKEPSALDEKALKKARVE